MNYYSALARFEAHCPPNGHPALTEDQVTEALTEAVTADDAGVEPTEDGWVPTYSVIGVWRAVVRGWEMKLGATAGAFDFVTDGQSFRRGQISDHCEAMVKNYRRRLAQSTDVG